MNFNNLFALNLLVIFLFCYFLFFSILPIKYTLNINLFAFICLKCIEQVIQSFQQLRQMYSPSIVQIKRLNLPTLRTPFQSVLKCFISTHDMYQIS